MCLFYSKFFMLRIHFAQCWRNFQECSRGVVSVKVKCSWIIKSVEHALIFRALFPGFQSLSTYVIPLWISSFQVHIRRIQSSLPQHSHWGWNSEIYCVDMVDFHRILYRYCICQFGSEQLGVFPFPSAYCEGCLVACTTGFSVPHSKRSQQTWRRNPPT